MQPSDQITDSILIFHSIFNISVLFIYHPSGVTYFSVCKAMNEGFLNDTMFVNTTVKKSWNRLVFPSREVFAHLIKRVVFLFLLCLDDRAALL